MSHDRFFLDHGAIHDRMTGQHVGMQAEIEWQPRLLNLLNEMWERITALERSDRAAPSPATAEVEGIRPIGELADWINTAETVASTGDAFFSNTLYELVAYLKTLGDRQVMREALILIAADSGLDNHLIKGADAIVFARMGDIHQSASHALSVVPHASPPAAQPTSETVNPEDYKDGAVGELAGIPFVYPNCVGKTEYLRNPPKFPAAQGQKAVATDDCIYITNKHIDAADEIILYIKECRSEFIECTPLASILAKRFREGEIV